MEVVQVSYAPTLFIMSLGAPRSGMCTSAKPEDAAGGMCEICTLLLVQPLIEMITWKVTA